MSITVKTGWAVDIVNGEDSTMKTVTIKKLRGEEYVVHSVLHLAASPGADIIVLAYEVVPAAFDKN
ncbi:hypothetical protein UFOVP375_10 [uncultured Caudovirales phage]|uniref:Uncharacterized protein n=1 Tax=uncultured Caudovirales phage TaxID=2100421 RepID=A0A6J7XQE5_9CAUD|nr:hypothetical protein UFOVP375_10 [uncultured Caudovirales phage]